MRNQSHTGFVYEHGKAGDGAQDRKFFGKHPVVRIVKRVYFVVLKSGQSVLAQRAMVVR